jgi:heat shock protein HslJ
VPLDESLLTGRTFVATAGLVNGVERRIVGPADEPEPHRLRLTFGDGTVTATAGCSSGTGPYTLEMQRIEGLTMTPASDCPPELLDQDAWLHDLFSTPPSIGVDGDYLTLGNQVDTIMVFVDEAAETPVVAPSPLAGTTWTLDARSSGVEPATTSTLGFGANLVLGDGATPAVYLRDGCTIVTGAVEIEVISPTSGAIAMSDLERIDAPCATSSDPVVEVMTEIQTGTWSYAIDINRLELTNGTRTIAFQTT